MELSSSCEINTKWPKTYLHIGRAFHEALMHKHFDKIFSCFPNKREEIINKKTLQILHHKLRNSWG